MPPITRPASRKSNRSIETAEVRVRSGAGSRAGVIGARGQGLAKKAPRRERGGRFSSLQTMYRLLQAGLDRPRQRGGRDAAIFPALPLADPPDFAQHAGFQLGIAENGLEGAGFDRLDDFGAVDLADLFD